MQHAIELIEISQIKKLSTAKLATFLTPRELAYCAWFKKRQFEHIAARIAAKQALKKCMPKAEWLEIEIRKEEQGKPYFVFGGKTASLMKRKKIHLSLSHIQDEALASIVISKT